MTRLINARFEDGATGLSDEVLRDQMVTFMIAGHEVSFDNFGVMTPYQLIM